MSAWLGRNIIIGYVDCLSLDYGKVLSPLFQNYGKKAVNEFRDKGEEKFVREAYKAMDDHHSSCKTYREPTFWEFVQFVLKRPTQDDHWKPFSQVCSVCKVKYTHVLHFEMLEQEEMEFLGKMGLAEQFPPLYMNRESGQKKNVTERYLKMLRKVDLKRLLLIYNQDIEIFGYKNDTERLMDFIFPYNNSKS